MALPVNADNGRGPSNKMYHHLQPKKTKVMLYLAFIYHFTRCTLLTRQSKSILQVGVSYRW